MIVKKRWTSIRWKIVFIYFLLVFIATTIIGVFIMNQLEAYYKDSIRTNISKWVQDAPLLSSLQSYDDLKGHQEEIQANIISWSKSVPQEIFVVDDEFSIIS